MDLESRLSEAEKEAHTGEVFVLWQSIINYYLKGLCHNILVYFLKLKGVLASIEFQK